MNEARISKLLGPQLEPGESVEFSASGVWPIKQLGLDTSKPALVAVTDRRVLVITTGFKSRLVGSMEHVDIQSVDEGPGVVAVLRDVSISSGDRSMRIRSLAAADAATFSATVDNHIRPQG